MDSQNTEMLEHLTRLSSIIGQGFKVGGETKKMIVIQNISKRQTVGSWPVVNMTVQRRLTVSSEALRRKPLIGGTAITYDIAKDLRQVVYGSSIRWFSRDWRRAAFCFQSIDSDFPYGLHAEKCGSRGVIMCVQAHVLTYLFEKYRGGTDVLGCSALEPSGSERKMALIHALCRVLWRAGQELERCYVCLPQDTEFFSGTPQYHPDGLTEQLLLFQFNKYEELEGFMRRHVQFFEEDGARGVILFIYSVVLSRTIPRVYNDAGTTKLHLIGHMEEMTMPLANLLLTGRANRYIHNGTLVYDKDGELLEPPLVGIGERSEIGLLYWEKMEDEGNRTEVGSMYRTPKSAIWLTWINHTQFGVLFCLKTDLVSDWRAENWFTLNYYNGLPGQPKTSLTIDTRTERESRSKASSKTHLGEEKRIPLLEQCILSKWPGSAVNWNGVAPYF